jgi:hypothetical protein
MPAQVEQLIRMREEEKLAHDVYVTLAQTSGLQIFNNIAMKWTPLFGPRAAPR